jgi:hypothetical protein
MAFGILESKEQMGVSKQYHPGRYCRILSGSPFHSDFNYPIPLEQLGKPFDGTSFGGYEGVNSSTGGIADVGAQRDVEP